MFSNFGIYRWVWNNYYYNIIYIKFSSVWVEDNFYIYINNMDYWLKYNNIIFIFINDCINNYICVFNYYVVFFVVKLLWWGRNYG